MENDTPDAAEMTAREIADRWIAGPRGAGFAPLIAEALRARDDEVRRLTAEKRADFDRYSAEYGDLLGRWERLANDTNAKEVRLLDAEAERDRLRDAGNEVMARLARSDGSAPVDCTPLAEALLATPGTTAAQDSPESRAREIAGHLCGVNDEGQRHQRHHEPTCEFCSQATTHIATALRTAAHQHADRLAELEEEVRGVTAERDEAKQDAKYADAALRNMTFERNRQQARAETAEAAHAAAQGEVERLREGLRECVEWSHDRMRVLDKLRALLRDAPTPGTAKP